MRSDMAKVLVERPRHGAAYLQYRHRRHAFDRKSRSREDLQATPLRMGMGFGRGKSLNENLRPLKRFLLTRRGRKWDRVYAELRAHLAPRNTVDMHVMQHLWEYVLFARRERSGKLILVDAHGRARYELRANGEVLGIWYYRDIFYVCEETRRLIYLPRPTWR